MAIDFFISRCTNTLSSKKFGLCDDSSLPNAQAYTDIINIEKWIATVNNPNSYEVTFIAVDACLKIVKVNGDLDSRCDAMLKYEDNIVFVELKDRDGTPLKWIKKAEQQLKITINHFKDNYNISDFTKKVAYISNIQHPNFRSSQKERMQTFKDETDIILKITATIDL